MLTILSGLAAGVVHVVSGPDHLAALAPLVADEPRRGAGLGLRWGLGHGFAVVAMGGLGMMARASIDIERLSALSEVAVGFVLIAVGLWALRKASRIVVHAHAHDHHQDGHSHLHVHDADVDHEQADAHRGHSHAAYAVGALHGAAGTGHLLGVLPSLALPPTEAAIYLGAYFVSAVVAMVLFGALIGMVSNRRGPRTLRRLMYASSFAAILIGLVWVGQSWPA